MQEERGWEVERVSVRGTHINSFSYEWLARFQYMLACRQRGMVVAELIAPTGQVMRRYERPELWSYKRRF